MNKVILVGIDFSDCSINALEHAITIARKANASIAMVWINHLDYSKEIFSVEPQNIEKEVTKRFEALVKKFKYHLHGEELKYYIRKGKVYKEICKVANEIEAFLVVIGTHGSSGFEEFWIGSNANRIITASTRPIITIRNGVDAGTDLKKIVMPLDSTIITRQKLPVTALLAKYFKSEVHILGMFTTSSDDIRFRIRNYVVQAEEYFAENDITYKSKFIEADNITDGTLKYAKKIKANLISIMTEQETTTANLLLGPYASQMVNHSPIPVLSIHASKY
ncbi:MAG: universal stress protein [Bacteroidetes bacterium]|nr:universal stress protein [Bacteroidota bacterium]MBL6943152.1 universal stress protein [Bacteroidales bacterium]